MNHQQDQPDWDRIREVLDAAVATLSTTDRTLIALRYLAGRSISEVAAVVQSNDEVVKKRVQRATTRLRNALCEPDRAAVAGVYSRLRATGPKPPFALLLR